MPPGNILVFNKAAFEKGKGKIGHQDREPRPDDHGEPSPEQEKAGEAEPDQRGVRKKTGPGNPDRQDIRERFPDAELSVSVGEPPAVPASPDQQLGSEGQEKEQGKEQRGDCQPTAFSPGSTDKCKPDRGGEDYPDHRLQAD